VPLLVPLAPLVMVIQPLLLVAVHPQPVPLETVIEPLAALDNGSVDDVGEMVIVHGAPAWVTVKVLPPMVNVPVREVVALLALTLYPTEPLPLPLAPDVTVIHEALLVAVHAHPAPAVTFTVPVAATDVVKLDAVGRIVKEQGAPGWVTVNVLPPTVIVPVCVAALVFAATL